jgi:hypothetical protein
MSDPDQGLPGDGDTETPPDGGTEEPEEPETPEEPTDPGAQAPPLATDPILADHVDVPNLGGPVGAGQANAIGSAVAAAQVEEPSS